jgi:hypothetical protein
MTDDMREFREMAAFLAVARGVPERVEFAVRYLQYAAHEGFVGCMRRECPEGLYVAAVMTAFPVRAGEGFSWPANASVDEGGDGIWIDELAAVDWNVVPGLWRSAVGALGVRGFVGWAREGEVVWHEREAVERRLRD